MDEEVPKVKEELQKSMTSDAKPSSEPEVSDRERQLQDSVKRWQAQTQALQQEDIQLKTELAAAYLAERTHLIWFAPLIPLMSVLLLTAPYYVVHRPAAYTVDAILCMIAFIALAAMVCDGVSSWFRTRCKIRTGNAAVGGHVPAGAWVCGKLTSTSRSWYEPKPAPWNEELRAGRSRLQALVTSGGELAEVALQVTSDNSTSKNPSQGLALPKCSIKQLQEQAQAWQIQQQALNEEQVNARLKSDLADTLAYSTGYSKFAWFIGPLFVVTILQFIALDFPNGMPAAGWNHEFVSTLLFQCFWAFILVFYLMMIETCLARCKDLSDKSQQLSQEVASTAAANWKTIAEDHAQIQVICHET